MMKKLLMISLCYPCMIFAQGGSLFTTQYSIQDGNIDIEISSTVPNRSYKNAGITIPNAYSFINNSCHHQQGQTCIFSVSSTSSVHLEISGPAGIMSNTLCLNQPYQLNCERSTIQRLTNSLVVGGDTNGVIYLGVNNSNWSVYSPEQFINTQFKASYCTNTGDQCIAGGFYDEFQNSDYVPNVYYSTDYGTTWRQSDITNMTSSSGGAVTYPIQVWNMTCNSSARYCISGGNATVSSTENGIVWYSRDLGETWSEAYIQPLNGVYRNYATSCYQSSIDNTNKCIVVGAVSGNNTVYIGHGVGTQVPMSLSGASSITIPSGNLIVLQGATCSSNDNCVLVGFFEDASNTILQSSAIYYSTDGGDNWIQSHIADLGPVDAEVINLAGVSCDKSGQYCVAAGWYSTSATNRYPAYGLVYTSNDGGQNWDHTIMLNAPNADSDVNRMNAVSCTENSGVCMVSGHGGYSNVSGTPYFPISYISYDHGKSWSNASVMPFPSGVSSDDVFSLSLFEGLKVF